MNHGRVYAGATVADDKLFVVGGGESGPSIEMLNLKKLQEGWVIIPNEIYQNQFFPLVCAVSSQEVLVCGGDREGNDVLLLDTQTGTLERIFEAPFRFWTDDGNN